MTPAASPAATAFCRWAGDGAVFGMLWIRPLPPGHELRHAEDAAVDASALSPLPVESLREMARHDAQGGFRPLKSAPTLRRGWRCGVSSAAELERALEHLHPGGLADWAAVQAGTARAVPFREFAGRQSGIYACVREAGDDLVRDVACAGCGPGACVKRRMWEVPGMPSDGVDKGALPCLEPCAVLLEFVRRAVRMEAEPRREVVLGGSDLETLAAALEAAVSAPARPGARVGDLADPANPRRFGLLLAKLRRQFPA